jgi:DNA polymerase-3 subunit delta
MLQQLESALPHISKTNVLLLTSQSKPDSRNKSVKLLLSHATVKEFPLIPLWLTDALKKLVRALADEIGVAVANDACQLLVELIGNNTRLLFTELEKLKLYTNSQTITADAIKALVLPNATNSLQLATAIRSGNVATALELLENLFNYNEPALKIVATLTTSFRRWFVVKLCVTDGWRDDSAIASLALIKNPKQLYFIRQEITNVPINRLQKALEILLQLELMLKTGWDEKLAMQTQIIKICV